MTRSSIAKLDPRIREAVDKAIREGEEIDDIVQVITDMGGQASRSAVGRYAKSARDQMRIHREAREMAKIWVAKLGDEPDGDVARLLIEMLRTVSFQTLASMGEGDAPANVEDIMLLAKSLKDLASADKLALDRELRIRKEVVAEAAKAAAKTGKARGLTADVVADIKASILGVSR